MNQGNDLNIQEMKKIVAAELANIDKLREELEPCRDMQGAERIKGSILHDFYNICERIFKLVAREINGDMDMGEHWHKQLLYRMTLELGDIRPPVITKELAASLDEFLAFRHLFRNIYGFELTGGRLDALVRNFPPTAERFKREIEDFLSLV